MSTSHRLIPTADGSFTVHSPQFNATYHSVHGAVQESMHVFIEAGLKPCQDKDLPALRIFEMGFGTGLNCFLTWKEAPEKKVDYEAVELFPLESSLTEPIASSICRTPEERSFFERMHNCDWNQKEDLAKMFSLVKIKTDVNVFEPRERYHLIYFDAFDPATQPALWKEELFAKIHSWMLPGAQLLTYCAKGEVKRLLRKIGFYVETLPGPPHKREMIRATR